MNIATCPKKKHFTPKRFCLCVGETADRSLASSIHRNGLNSGAWQYGSKESRDDGIHKLPYQTTHFSQTLALDSGVWKGIMLETLYSSPFYFRKIILVILSKLSKNAILVSLSSQQSEVNKTMPLLTRLDRGVISLKLH